MNVDGQELIVLTAQQILVMATAAQTNGADRFYLFTDKAGKTRFGALEVIPEQVKRGQPLSLSARSE